MNQLKLNILEMLHNEKEPNSLLKEMLNEYEMRYPMDLDLYGMKTDCYLWSGNIEEAYKAAKEAVRKNPYNWEVNSKIREVCELMENYAEAIKYDTIANFLQNFFNLSHEEGHLNLLEEKLAKEGEEFAAEGNAAKLEEYKRSVSDLVRNLPVFFGIYDLVYGEENNVVGTYYTDKFGNSKYNAIYNDVGIENYLLKEQKKNFNNWLQTKLECIEVRETESFKVDNLCDYLLPVLTDEEDTEYRFIMDEGKEIVCRSKKEKHFEYYRVPPATEIESEKVLYLGNPIPLIQDKTAKKLVLNIFVDGLSQKILEEDFMEYMPNTYKFFSKGIICENAYTAAEWTLPSVASYMTGLNSLNHMLIHNVITNQLPEDITILTEYFKGQGYQTAKIDGDWRSTQSYGYGRGMDRIIYQHQCIGMRAEQVIPDVLDHMELMKETNQFIWMCVGDLHDVADGFSLKPSVQAAIPLKNRSVVSKGKTSVKQGYSENKRISYIKQMKHVDDCLNVLYQYIENNYQDEEIVISLFGDHGQGYLVGEEEHFLAEGRSKVGMMFRSDFKKGEVCRELISACDYKSIMCKLAGIQMKDEQLDGSLPVFFGGEKEKEYVITESIHPGDFYTAAIVSKENTFYFTSGGKVNYDGRFELGDYSYVLIDKHGKESNNKTEISKYLNIIIVHIGGMIMY